ncbi:GNAT family N-acetyltransferase [Natrialbaceae archaeon A-arb3/5]
MEIEFRPAKEGDLELMMAWRSHPQLYENLHSQDGPLEWDDHLDWWESREDRRDWIITVRTGERWRDVGIIALSGLDSDYPSVGVWVGEITLWGEGIATEAVKFSINWLQKRDYSGAVAGIYSWNNSSQQVFEKAGFKQAESLEDNRYNYRIEFDSHVQ